MPERRSALVRSCVVAVVAAGVSLALALFTGGGQIAQLPNGLLLLGVIAAGATGGALGSAVCSVVTTAATLTLIGSHRELVSADLVDVALFVFAGTALTWLFTRLDHRPRRDDRFAELDLRHHQLKEESERRRRAEDSLRLTQAVTASVLDQLPVGVLVEGVDGTLQLANREAREILQHPLEPGSKLPRSDEVHPFRGYTPGGEPLGPDAWPLARALRGESIRDERIVLELPGGSEKVISVNAGPIRAAGRITAAVVTFLDVTTAFAAEDKLRESEERFRLAADAVEGVIYDWMLASSHVERSAGLERVLGFRPDEAEPTSQWWLDRIHPDDRAGMLEGEARARASGAQRSVLEYRVRHRDGTYRHVVERFMLLRGETGQVVREVGCTVDVTDRKRAENELRASEQALRAGERHLRNVIDNLFAFVGVLGPDGTLLEANRAPLEESGLSADDVRGLKFWDCFWWNQDAAVQREVKNACQAAARGEASRFDVPMRLAQGRRIVLDFQIAPLHDASGTITHLIPSGVDVTGRVRAEEELRLSEDRFRRQLLELQGVYDAAPVGLCVLDTDLRWVRVNERLAEITGYPAPMHLGRRLSELLPGLTADLEPTLARVLEGGDPIFNFELNGETPAQPGVPRAWVLNLLPLRDPRGRVIGINLVCQDVTERKRIERALREADQRKDDFLATLAHELRNPLAPIRSAVEILRAVGGLPEMAAQGRDVIDRQVRHLTRLVDDLLDVSRISRGKIRLHLAPVDLRPVIEQAIETSRPLITARGHRLEVSFPDEVLRVEADADRLAQVAANLLNNAAKYTSQPGEIRLDVRAEDGTAVIRVRDTGLGIAAEQLTRIFEPFAQVDQTEEQRMGGLGIGLSLVRSLVEMHGGTVTASSEGPGKGSEFVVRLPRLEVSVPAPAPKPAAPKDGRRRRVLVVDDNRDSVETLGTLLRILGHDVRTARDGAEGLAAAEEFQPEVVLLDIGMPGMSGYEVAAQLRRKPGGKEMMILALTGWGQDEDRRRSREAGFDHHFVKPVNPDDLHSLLVQNAS